MQILQVISDTDRRGAQVFATDLHPALEARGHTVRTVALARGANAEGLDVAVLGRRRRGLGTLTALRREMSAADVVAAHGSATLAACALAGPGTTPFVYRQVSDSLFWAPSTVRRLRVRSFLRRARRVVALASSSAAVLEAHFGVRPRKIHVVPNGVPALTPDAIDRSEAASLRRAFGLDPSRPTVLDIGALVPEKGVDLAIRSMQQRDDAQLLVVGDGPSRRSLETLAEEVAPGRVVFTGSLDIPLAAYLAADVVVLPSRGGDSMPATLIEAGMVGLAAVSTPVGAIEEIVRDGATGLIVPPGDQAAFDGALASLLDDPTRCAAMGIAAREHCLANFEIGVVASGWERALVDARR